MNALLKMVGCIRDDTKKTDSDPVMNDEGGVATGCPVRWFGCGRRGVKKIVKTSAVMAGPLTINVPRIVMCNSCEDFKILRAHTGDTPEWVCDPCNKT